MSTARYSLGGCGSQAAGLSFGGISGVTLYATTEEYDGAAWSTGGNLATARKELAGCGTLTSGLAFGGSNGGATEEYDGTTWTSGGGLNTIRSK